MPSLRTSSSTGPGLAAIAATVVDKFHKGQIALRVATCPVGGVIEDGIGIGAQKLGLAHGLGFLLALLQHADGLHQNFRIFQQIAADRRAKGRALSFGHRGEIKGRSRGGQPQAQGGGGEKAHITSPGRGRRPGVLAGQSP